MWIVILIAVVVISASIIAGGISEGNSGGAPGPADNCAGCRKLDSWWAILDGWGKFFFSAWYALQKTGCAINGCNK